MYYNFVTTLLLTAVLLTRLLQIKNTFASSFFLEKKLIMPLNLFHLRAAFHEHFQLESILFYAPGRINLIGEHTDYNHGFVLPAAIDKRFYIAIAKNDTNTAQLLALPFLESESFDLDARELPNKQWVGYFFGMTKEINKIGKKIGGFSLACSSDIAIGAGLSSSAALCCCFGTALNELFNLQLTKIEIAKLAQLTEHNYIGVKCGIMDQYASLFGEKNALIKLDCDDYSHKIVPFLQNEVKIVLFDSQVKHNLASTEYNIRRENCEEVVHHFKKLKINVESLRNISLEDLEKEKNKLSEISYKRAKFVLEENNRVLEFCKALNHNDINKLGQLLFASHSGLQNDYNVSCSELDFLVETAKKTKGIIGARMMGGGFGGCTINLVQPEYYAKFIEEMIISYEKKYYKSAKYYEFEISNGAQSYQIVHG